MDRSRLALITVVAWFAGTAGAQEEEPDLSFLEYLGSWQESDEEWLVVVEMEGELETEDEASAKDEETDATDDD